MQTSARRQIQHPSLDRSDRPDVPLHMSYLVAALELDPSLTKGSLASRPADPGYPNYFYWATDVKLLYFWDGATWTAVGSADVIAQTLVDAKGDLIVGIADNNVARVGVGANGFTLQADNAQAAGVKWALNAVIDKIAAKGDLIVGTAVDTIDRVAVGVDGAALIADSAQAVGVRWGAVPLVTFQAKMSADVAISSANTYTDATGLSLTLPAGKYLINASLTLVRGGPGAQWTAKIWDGSNPAIASVAQTGASSGEPSPMSMSVIETIGSTTTFKVSVAATGTGSTIKAAAPANSGGNTASILNAVQLA